jgi:hypothetical protein
LNSKPDVALRKQLSDRLDMTPREVQVWVSDLNLISLSILFHVGEGNVHHLLRPSVNISLNLPYSHRFSA